MKAIRRSTAQWIMIILLLTGSAACLAQKPVIREVDKVSAGSGSIVSLQGTFNNDPTRVSVSFGAARGDVRFVSDQLLEVAVPPGATYKNIVVTDLTSGLSDQSPAAFLPSFGGNHGLTAGSLEGQADFNSESGLYDLCMCDFDGDGRVDVATANDGANTLNLFANTTALPGLSNISFNRIPLLIGANSLHASCGDLNGDGKPDLIISEGGASGNRLFFFRNTSAGPGSFTFSIQSISLTGKKVKRTDISDLDNDGKPDVIVTNQTGSDVTVLVNTSTTAAIAFSATPLTFTVPGAASTDGLAVADLDADGLPEIVTTQFLTQTSNVFILKNNSLPGNISFNYDQTLDIGGTVVNLKVGDLDGDARPEIAVTQLIGDGTVSVFRNETSGSIAFAAPVTFATDVRPWGLDFGDMDGDGMTDIVVASLEKSLTILNNESTATELAFSTLVQPTTYINRHIAVGDVDGDAKPDIVFTSVDDNNNNILASKVSVFRNKHCLAPAIDPAGPITVCTGFPLQLTTTASSGVTYEWKNGAATEKSGADAFLDVTASGSYTVTATGEGGNCVETSNTVSVSVDPGTTTGPAAATNDGPVCPGSTLNLSVNDVGATAYNWTGPNGYTGSGLTPSPIANFQPENAGRYFVDVVVNGCIAQQVSTVVDLVSIPDFQISYAGSGVICPPDTKTLTLIPNDPNFTYQWAERTTGDIAGETGASVSVSTSGRYFVKAQLTSNPSCAAVETPEVDITFSAAPVADFTAPLTACTGQDITFVNQSTVDPSAQAFYTWSFGDGQTSALEDATHQFTSANTYNVTLSVAYSNGACEDQVAKAITVENSPAVSITTPGNNLQVCEGDSIALEVSGATFSSYQWSTGETTPVIYITEPGNYSVDVTTATCFITAAASVASVPAPVVLVNAEPAEVVEGKSAQLGVIGLTAVLWTPAESLNDPASTSPVASPLESTIYTVTGTDDNGCSGIATVEVRVKGDFIITKLFPEKFISPDNGDAINNYWLIENILNYPQCSVTIYDDKGIAVYDAKPYNNDWTGTFNGRPLPDGVYYYIIRCDGEEHATKTGSITILR